MNALAERIVELTLTGHQVPEIIIAVENENPGINETQLGEAMDMAAEHFRREGNRATREAAALEAIERQSRAPGAKTVAEGLRERARTGDETASALMKRLEVEP